MKTNSGQNINGVMKGNYLFEGKMLNKMFLTTSPEIGTRQVKWLLQNDVPHLSAPKIAPAPNKYGDLFQSAPISSLILDRTGQVIEANIAATRLLAATPAALTQTNFTAYLAPDSEKTFEAHLQALFEIGKPHSCEVSLLPLTGKLCWVQVESVPTRDAHGVVNHCQTMLIDITVRKETEFALREAEAAAEEAKQAVETATRSKCELVAKMTHELCTPLNIILGYTQFLTEQVEEGSPQAEDLEVIRQNGEYLLAVIDDTLSLSKIEAQKMTLNVNDFSLQSFLNNLVDLFQFQARQKGLRFQLNLSSPLPDRIQGDELRLRQILINLLGNAVKFTQKGKVTLTAGHPLREDGQLDRDLIRFQVEDTGIGIPHKALTEIFSLFYQINHGDGDDKGTGLGLAISQSLAHLMGSEIKVRSRPGQKTIFWLDVKLPASGNSGVVVPQIIGGETTTIPKSDVETNLVPPPMPNIIALHDLAQRGDIRGILEQATEIEQFGARFQPFVSKLRQLAKGYQIHKIQHLVERYQGN